jgi:outer membrane receptor for ferrienterochelin and colicins
MSEPLSSPVLLTVRSAAAFRAAIVVALAASRLAVADDQQPSPASSSTPAPSFDDNNAATATAGEVIVVTGTRSETPLAASPVTTEVIDRKRLEESGVQTVSEALTLRPGLWIDHSVAGTSGITIQGLGPQYSLILVDGARQIGRTDGDLDLDRFGIADIEQIEIVRGPSSALYGADALGGVVNIITRKPKDGFVLDTVGQIDGRLGSATRARVAVGKRGAAGALIGEYREGPAIRRDDESAVATTLDSYADRHIGGRIIDDVTERWRVDGSADYLCNTEQTSSNLIDVT